MQKDPVLSASLRVGDTAVAYTLADAAHGSNPRHEDGERPDDQWMQQHAHLTRLCGGAPMPLTLLAQRARATTANAGRIHDAQTAIGFSAPFMHHEGLLGRTAQGPIWLEGEVSPREAARASCAKRLLPTRTPEQEPARGSPCAQVGAREQTRWCVSRLAQAHDPTPTGGSRATERRFATPLDHLPYG
jgi:hypothetical protein